MTCQKCKGLMIEVQQPELAPDGVGHRCINCGLYLDPLIQQNRQGAGHRRDALVQAA